MRSLTKQKPQDRRQGTDRRKRDRRRSAAERAVVIEISRNALRTGVLTKSADGGSDLVDASMIPWREAAEDLRSPEAVKELTAGFRQAASRHALVGDRLHIVLSGEYCVTRVIRGPSESVRGEIKGIEERSRLYLALGPGEKAVVSHQKALSARVTHALAVACHQETLENLQTAIEAAGLHVECVEPQLTALSRAAARLPDLPEGPYLLALVDGETLELGLCHRGELLTDYRPGGRIGATDLPRLIDQHLGRLERFAARFVNDEEGRVERIYVAGDAETVQRARLELAAATPIDVATIDAPRVQASWQIKPDAVASVTPTTLGGLLAAYLPSSQRECPNLLEHLVALSREPLRPVVLRLLAPVAATLLLAAALSTLAWNEQKKVADAEQQLSPLALVQGRATELRLKKHRTAQKLAQLNALAEQLPGVSGREALLLVSNSMPNDVWLRRFAMLDLRTITLEGASYVDPGVYEFVDWLEQAPRCKEVALRGLNPGSSEAGPVTNFNLEAVLADEPAPVQEVASRE